MRWLFILLLLSNVLYLGWEIDRETKIGLSKTGSVLSIPNTAKKLKLINEMESHPLLRTREPQIDNAQSFSELEMELITNQELVAELPEILVNDADEFNSSELCYRYGPIPDEEIVKGLYDWFRSRGGLGHIQYTDEQSSQMFWAYLAPQQSRESALAIMQEMKTMGIGEYRLINRGELENAISLGLYSNREAVNSRLRELNDKGFVPVVVPYTDVNKIFWLDIKLTNTSTAIEDMIIGFPARYGSVPVNCNDISYL